MGADGPVINTPRCARFVRRVAQRKFGAEAVTDEGTPVYASEDFADFLQLAPGAFFFSVVSHLPPDVGLHHNQYNFDDSIIQETSELWWEIVHERLNGNKELDEDGN